MKTARYCALKEEFCEQEHREVDGEWVSWDFCTDDCTAEETVHQFTRSGSLRLIYE
jgi:hypothetical protein